MEERIRQPQEILTSEQIKKIQEKCCYEDENEQFFEIENFVNGYAIVHSGERDYEFSSEVTNVIDYKGNYIEVNLNKKIKYSDGKIMKLDKEDNGSYYFEISRIIEKSKKLISTSTIQISNPRHETAFFVIKVTRHSKKRDEETEVYTFVINSKLEVIASFKDKHLYGIKYDGYNYCEQYTERDFCFINKDRNYLIFSQKIMVNSEEDGFFNSHMHLLDPDAYDDFLRENDPNYYSYDWENGYDESIDEENLDDETIKKAFNKSNGLLTEEDDEFNSIPYLEDINFFFEDTKNKLYKKNFTDYYKNLYGIIDTQHKSIKELIPFTDKSDKVARIINSRIIEEEKYIKYGVLRKGWDWNDKKIIGPILQNKFFHYPPRVAGLTLKYLHTYYPDLLSFISEKGIMIIPNKLLNTLKNTELIRDIRLNQEIHLKYNPIYSAFDTLCSLECQGIISSFQGKTIKEIIYSKGGTKYLATLVRLGKLEIENDVIEELSSNTNNEIEKKCYEILLSVIEDIEYMEEREQAWIQDQMDKHIAKESEREFNNLMDDSDAWGNLD